MNEFQKSDLVSTTYSARPALGKKDRRIGKMVFVEKEQHTQTLAIWGE
jgi:hypothetical protein